MSPKGSPRGPGAPYPPALPQLSHTVLATRPVLKACITDTLEAAFWVGTAALVTEATADNAFFYIWEQGGRHQQVTPLILIQATDAGYTWAAPLVVPLWNRHCTHAGLLGECGLETLVAPAVIRTESVDAVSIAAGAAGAVIHVHRQRTLSSSQAGYAHPAFRSSLMHCL